LIVIIIIIFNGNGNPMGDLKLGMEWEKVRMKVDGNGDDPYSHGKSFHRLFFTVVDLH